MAHGIYDFVDRRIQELDSQLVEFDKELAAERERLGVESVPSLLMHPLATNFQDLAKAFLCNEIQAQTVRVSRQVQLVHPLLTRLLGPWSRSSVRSA